jgi:beta-1,4-N-acetylglucosaminyltransferase
MQQQQQQQQQQQAAVGCEVIPRSREVGQSYVTSVFTTLYSLAWAAWMVTRHRPQLVRERGC